MNWWYKPSLAEPVRKAVISSFLDTESPEEPKPLPIKETKKRLIKQVSKAVFLDKRETVDKRFIETQIEYMANSHHMHYLGEDSYVFSRDEENNYFLRPATTFDHFASFCLYKS